MGFSFSGVFLFFSFSEQANLADSGETLSRRNFSRALKELDIQAHGWEADALLDRFEVDEGENVSGTTSQR